MKHFTTAYIITLTLLALGALTGDAAGQFECEYGPTQWETVQMGCGTDGSVSTVNVPDSIEIIGSFSAACEGQSSTTRYRTTIQDTGPLALKLEVSDLSGSSTGTVRVRVNGLDTFAAVFGNTYYLGRDLFAGDTLDFLVESKNRTSTEPGPPRMVVSGFKTTPTIFAGIYAPANWTTDITHPANYEIDTTGAPNSITMTAFDDASAGAARYFITAPVSGRLSFVYNANGDTTDSFTVRVNGLPTNLSISQSSPIPQGRVLDVQAGDAIEFRLAGTLALPFDTVVQIRGFDGPAPWDARGCALAGVNGDPALAGNGNLSAGSDNSVGLSSAAPSAPTLVFTALSSTPVPFKGGTLVPVPWLKASFTNTTPAGRLVLPFVMPAGVPPGTEIWLQTATADAAAEVGVSLSNALLGTTP